MKKMIKKIIILLTQVFIPGAICLALDFVPLESGAPWITDVSSRDPGKFFENMFNIALTVAATLAVIMIMYGGVKYMTTDAWSGKEEAKDIIQSAIYGLIIAMVAGLILYTINPDILNIRI